MSAEALPKLTREGVAFWLRPVPRALLLFGCYVAILKVVGANAPWWQITLPYAVAMFVYLLAGNCDRAAGRDECIKDLRRRGVLREWR